MEPDYEITPKRTAFLTFPLAIFATIFFVIAGIITVILSYTQNNILITLSPIAAALFLLVLYYLNQNARFNKEETEFYKDKIIHKTGTLFSNNQTTLRIKNITHVQLKHPFIRHHLFGTSTIHIQAAGSGSMEVHMQSILHGEDIYEYTQELMKDNGFSLSKETLRQEETPSKTAVIGKQIAGMAFFILFIFPGLLASLFLAPVLLLGVIPVLALWYIIFQNQTQRRFQVYNDVLEHHKDFMTKKHSLIPAENLAEANNNQGLLDRIFGVSNIEVTTQGDAKISYSNIPNGETLEQHIDDLTKSYEPIKRESVEKTEDVKAEKQKDVESTDYTSTHEMNIPRAIVAGLGAGVFIGIGLLIYGISQFSINAISLSSIFIGLFVLIAGTIFGSVMALINAKVTTYEVRKQGVWEKRSFISRSTKEFSDDKLVGIEIKRNPLDMMMGTANISFQSLSSSSNITFNYIKEWEELVQNLEEKYYLNSPLEKTYNADYKIRYRITKNLIPYGITTLVLALAGIAIAYFTDISLTWIYGGIGLILFLAFLTFLTGFLRYRNSYLKLYEEHLEYRVGYFFEKRELVRYEDVKNQYSIDYRYAPVGSLHVGIGGMVRGAEEQNQQQAALQKNGFTGAYLPNTPDLLDTIDEKIITTNNGFNEPDTVAKKAVKNRVVSALIFAVPTLGLSLLYLPISLWRTSKYRYDLEKTRILMKRGIWNKRKKSVLFVNIDHISKDEGFINKLCGNGNVSIYTLGSDDAEIAIKDVYDYSTWRDRIESSYD